MFRIIFSDNRDKTAFESSLTRITPKQEPLFAQRKDYYYEKEEKKEKKIAGNVLLSYTSVLSHGLR